MFFSQLSGCSVRVVSSWVVFTLGCFLGVFSFVPLFWMLCSLIGVCSLAWDFLDSSCFCLLALLVFSRHFWDFRSCLIGCFHGVRCVCNLW